MTINHDYERSGRFRRHFGGDSFRVLFVCGGGVGPNSFDAVNALEQWVEQGKAPDQIIASHRGADGKVDRTRPLCPYPQVAKYKGSGSIDDSADFVCSAQ